MDELVRSVLAAREEREEREKEKKGKGRGGAKAGENGEKGDAEAAAKAAAAPAAAEKAASFAPLVFVRRVVPVDAAVVEGGTGAGSGRETVLERLAKATRALVAGVDLRSLLERVNDSEKRGVKFAVCYRRHVPSEQEEEEGKEGAEERGEGGGGGAATAATAPSTTTTSLGLACRAAVTRTVAEALAAALKAAALLSGSSEPPSVDLKNPDVVAAVEVLPLGDGSQSLVATLALLPRRCCDGQLRVRGVSEEDCKQSQRGRQKRR